jgi:hypothetical protein
MTPQTVLASLTAAVAANLILVPAVSADKPAAPVTVTNTAADPVPIAGTVGVAGTASVNVVSMPQDGASLFNVPFFIEQVTGPPTKPSLSANFTLPRPAILESIAVTCGGHATGALLSVDGGPLDVNGVTGTPGSPDVGLVVGLFAGLQALYRLPLEFPAAGGAILPSYKIGAPVKSKFTFDLNQDTATGGAACFVNILFRNLS